MSFYLHFPALTFNNLGSGLFYDRNFLIYTYLCKINTEKVKKFKI